MKSLKSVIVFIVISVLGILTLVMSIRDKIELAKPPADIARMTEDDFYNGRYVEGYVYEIWGEYATMEESDTVFGISYNKRTSAHYMYMPLETAFETGVPKFIALSIRDGSDYSFAYKLMQETWDFYYNDIDFETAMPIRGKITKLTGENKKYFEDAMREEGFTPSEVSVYYVINVGNDGNGTTAELLIGIGITVVGVLGALFTIVRGRARG